MALATTRALVEAALSGAIEDAPTRADPNFGFAVPTAAAGVDPMLLDPRRTWDDGAAYDAAAQRLVSLFEANFAKFRITEPA
jgi:phosphoenolpyruvate carboxykinase (ATP)